MRISRLQPEDDGWTPLPEGIQLFTEVSPTKRAANIERTVKRSRRRLQVDRIERNLRGVSFLTPSSK